MIAKSDPGAISVPGVALASGYTTEGDTGSAVIPYAVVIDTEPSLKLLKDTGSAWEDHTPLADLPAINSLARHPRLVFNGSGRPVIAYWQAAIRVQDSGVMYGPFAGVDPALVNDRDVAASEDTILFYLNRDRDKIYYRLSSESYATEYLWYTFSATPAVRLDQAHLIAGPKIQVCLTEPGDGTKHQIQSEVIALYSEDWESYATGANPTGHTVMLSTYNGGAGTLLNYHVLDSDPVYDSQSVRGSFANNTNNVMGVRADNAPSVLDCTVGMYVRLDASGTDYQKQFVGGGVIARMKVSGNTTPNIGANTYFNLNGGFTLQDDTTTLDSTSGLSISEETVYYIELTVSGTSASAKLQSEDRLTTLATLSGTLTVNTVAGKPGFILAGPNVGGYHPWIDNFVVTV